jgi:hypothetical protein
MRPVTVLVAIVAAVSLGIGATPPARADMKGRIRRDDDHRYRLEITLARESAVVGDDVPTMFCLSPALDDAIEVCLGQHQGHWFFGGEWSVSTFRLQPDSDSLCTCERPVVLRRDQPLCWPMGVVVPNFGVSNVRVGGFVTVLEDVHEIGRAADSCVSADSNEVPFTIKTEKDDTAEPPSPPDPRLRT